MRFGSISLVLVVGIVGVACGGSGGAPTSSGGTPVNNSGSYETPPSNYQPPTALNPSTYEPPPGSYDTPPGQANAGGIGTGPSITDVWNRVCSEVLALNCDFSNLGNDTGGNNGNGNNGNGNNPSNPSNPNGQSGNMPVGMASLTDAQACAQAGEQLSMSIPCPDEFAAALSCILDNITLSCDTFTAADQGSIDPNIAVTCQVPLLAFASCAGVSSMPTPTPAGNCQPNTCIGCADTCETCLCQNSSDATLCDGVCST